MSNRKPAQIIHEIIEEHDADLDYDDYDDQPEIDYD